MGCAIFVCQREDLIIIICNYEIKGKQWGEQGLWPPGRAQQGQEEEAGAGFKKKERNRQTILGEGVCEESGPLAHFSPINKPRSPVGQRVRHNI